MNNYDNYFGTDMNFMNNFLGINSSNLINQNDYMKPTYKLDSNTGFIRGNMFDNLYYQYRNYRPTEIKNNTERDSLLNKVRQYKFAMIDLNLYLDTNPNDDNVLKIFNNYKNLEMQAVKEYESKYGPLTIDGIPMNANSWIWDNGPWPWEVQ